MKRFYVVITGSDGCGKETQSKLLVENLRNEGVEAARISFPNYDSPSSGPVKMYLSGEFGNNPEEFGAYEAALPYAVDRLCTMKKFLREDNESEVVVFDRYFESNLIYQTRKLKTEAEQEKFINWELDLELNKMGLPKPDLTIFLDVPLEVSFKLAQERTSQKNGQSKDIHELDYAFLKQSYDFSKKLANRFDWRVIDCTDNGQYLSREAIAQKILEVVNNCYYENGFTI